MTNPRIILVLGSNDLSVARFSARLALRHERALLVFSGGVAHHGDLLDTGWGIPEADVFADVALAQGIPEGRILKERRSTNTAENMIFSKKLIEATGHDRHDILLVHKPFMCLRALLTARHAWKDVEFGVEHEDVAFLDYYDRSSSHDLIDIIVGDTYRIMEYPKLGYFSPTHIPDPVRLAMDYLIGRNFVRHIPGGRTA